MSAKKQITIDVPDGLPDGWECVGYGQPVNGETMHHMAAGWMVTGDIPNDPAWLIARRTETAADWANKQPKLSALAKVLNCEKRHPLMLLGNGLHFLGSDDLDIEFLGEKSPNKHSGKTIYCEKGKWVDA